MPGQADFRVTEFAYYKQLMPEPELENTKRAEEQTLMLHELFAESGDAITAEISWRFSMPIMVLIVALIAQPLSNSSPRRGGPYACVFPGVLLYIVYLVSLNACKEAIAQGSAFAVGGIWLVHLGFLAIALALVGYPYIQLKRAARS